MKRVLASSATRRQPRPACRASVFRLSGWLALIVSVLGLGGVPTRAAPVRSDADLIRSAYLFGFPVYEMMRVRGNMTAAEGSGRNRFASRERLSTAQDRGVTAPNNDTLYASAWIDLAGGPIRLHLPALPGRYHSLEFMDVFTDAYAVLGTRNGGGRGGDYLIAGPGWRGTAPPGVRLIRAPTNDGWLLARILVDGEADLAAARAAQRAITLDAGSAAFRPFTVPTPPAPDPAAFLDAVNVALGRSPIPALHRARIAALRRVGLRPGQQGAYAALPAAIQAQWRRVMDRTNTELRDRFMAGGSRHDGWGYPEPGLAAFGTNDFYRSVVALGGLAALPAEEALYLNTTTDAAGAPLDGARRYRLRVPGNVPVDAFWSLTMYEPDAAGRFFFYANADNRFAIGDRTKDIVRERDGSIVILLQHATPAPGERANWLPAPPGRFRLSFRAYLPRAEFRDGRFKLPGIREVPAR